jgi:hypothetical protein
MLQANAYPLHAAALAGAHAAAIKTINMMETCCTQQQQREYVQHATVVSTWPAFIETCQL